MPNPSSANPELTPVPEFIWVDTSDEPAAIAPPVEGRRECLGMVR
jgi:hypothetical protein